TSSDPGFGVPRLQHVLGPLAPAGPGGATAIPARPARETRAPGEPAWRRGPARRTPGLPGTRSIRPGALRPGRDPGRWPSRRRRKPAGLRDGFRACRGPRAWARGLRRRRDLLGCPGKDPPQGPPAPVEPRFDRSDGNVEG